MSVRKLKHDCAISMYVYIYICPWQSPFTEDMASHQTPSLLPMDPSLGKLNVSMFASSKTGRVHTRTK